MVKWAIEVRLYIYSYYSSRFLSKHWFIYSLLTPSIAGKYYLTNFRNDDITLDKRNIQINIFLTVFDLITAHTPISSRSSNEVYSLQITASVFSRYFFIKAYDVGTHLNCINLLMQFKWVPTTNTFIKKIRKNHISIILKTNLPLILF